MVDSSGLWAAKLVLTPLLIGLVSLAARRFGPRVGGLLVGLPWTSAPVSVFLALQEGPGFAADAALATAAAVPAVAFFGLLYARTVRAGWTASLAAGLLGFLVVAGLAATIPPPLGLAVAAGVASILLGSLAMPRGAPASAAQPRPSWDVPARMLAATALVILLTGLARVLGPYWTGVLSPFPVFAAVLGVFLHRHEGPPAAIEFMQGILLGLGGFVGFFLVVALLVERTSLGATYGLAIAAALLANAGPQLALPRGRRDA